MPTYMRGGTMKTTLTARGSARGGATRGALARRPEPAAQQLPDAPDPSLLRGFRAAALELLCDEEARRENRAVMTKDQRRNARRRRDRAARPFMKTPAGRALLAREAETLDGARAAARMIARSVPELRAVVAIGVETYAVAVEEYDLHSLTARRWALMSGLYSALSLHFVGAAVERGSSLLTGRRSAKGEDGKTSAAITLPGFKDESQLSGFFNDKALHALEMSWRAEDRARQEAHAMRSRSLMAERQRAATMTTTASVPEPVTMAVTANAEPAEPERIEEQAHAPLTIDRAEPAHAPSRRPMPPKPAAPPQREPIVWCPNRMQMVPASVAGTPLRSASVVPRATVEKMKREGQAIPSNWTIEPEPEGEQS